MLDCLLNQNRKQNQSNMNTITRDIEQELKKIAHKLPAQPIAQTRTVKGSELIKENPTINEGRTEPIDPERMYTVQTAGVQQAVNHFKRIKSAYRQKGWPGVSVYVDPYRANPKADNNKK